MIFCIFYNIVNIACWCGLAYHFGRWWIALFGIFTMMEYRQPESDGGDKNAPN